MCSQRISPILTRSTDSLIIEPICSMRNAQFAGVQCALGAQNLAALDLNVGFPVVAYFSSERTISLQGTAGSVALPTLPHAPASRGSRCEEAMRKQKAGRPLSGEAARKQKAGRPLFGEAARKQKAGRPLSGMFALWYGGEAALWHVNTTHFGDVLSVSCSPSLPHSFLFSLALSHSLAHLSLSEYLFLSLSLSRSLSPSPRPPRWSMIPLLPNPRCFNPRRSARAHLGYRCSIPCAAAAQRSGLDSGMMIPLLTIRCAGD